MDNNNRRRRSTKRTAHSDPLPASYLESVKAAQVKQDALLHAQRELMNSIAANLAKKIEEKNRLKKEQAELAAQKHAAYMAAYTRQKQKEAIYAYCKSIARPVVQEPVVIVQAPPRVYTADDIKSHKQYRFFSRKAQQWLLENANEAGPHMDNHTYRLALESRLYNFPWLQVNSTTTPS